MSTKNTNSKSTPKSEQVSSSTPNLSVQTTPTPVLTETKKPSQKGSSKKNVKQTTDLTVQTTTEQTTEQTTPVLTTTEQTTPVLTTETKLNPKMGSKKKVKQTTPVVAETTPVVLETTPVVTETKSSQKGGSKKTKVEPQVEQSTTQTTKKEDLNEESKFEVELDGVDEQTNSGQRYFKLIYNNEIQGRYCGKKPKQAANKAFSSIIKDIKKTGEQKDGVNIDINFSIRECTRNSKHKEYKYVGIRESLDKPVKVTINNDDGSIKEITYNFHNKIQKAPKE